MEKKIEYISANEAKNKLNNFMPDENFFSSHESSLTYRKRLDLLLKVAHEMINMQKAHSKN